LRDKYQPLLDDMPEMDRDAAVSNNLTELLRYLQNNKLPPIYLIIDEYDNFANQLLKERK
jgi:hypothetical protein